MNLKTEIPSDVANGLCQQIDWERSEIAESAFASEWRRGNAEAAALGFVRYLRARERPHMGYTREYVHQLREHATPEFREQARQQVASLLGKGFQTGPHPDGRGTLLFERPEVLQVGAAHQDFEQYARNVIQGREMWEKSRHHTIVNIARFLQCVWPLEECADECLVPVFAFLVSALPREWASNRTWGEVMLGSNGHNWWVYQHGGLWKIGLLFPELKGCEQFQAFFPTYFEREISLLFHDDGFTRECSVSYHIGTVDGFLDAVRLAHVNGLRFSAGFHEKLRKAAEVEWKLMTPDGTFPDFGDCHASPRYVSDRLRSMAALHGLPEAKYLAEELFPETEKPFGEMRIESLHYPSVGEDLRSVYDELEPRPPESLDTALPISGYYAMRDAWTTSSNYAAIEASARGTIGSSHGHSAVFDLKLHSHGRPILIGNGKGPDVGDMTNLERMWRISNASHSTTTVDGEDHAPIRTIYRFGRVVMPTIEEWRSEEEFVYFSGSHEAYERLEKKVPGSRRKLFYLRNEYWILIDRFTAAGEDDPHTYQQHFQVANPVSLSEEGRALTTADGGNLLFVPVDGADGDASLGPCPHPFEGHPTPSQLCYTRETNGSFLFVTLLVPFLGDDVPEVEARLVEVLADGRALSSWEATGLEIRIGGRTDIYMDTHMHWNLPWRCGGHHGAERLFHSACQRLTRG